MADAPDLCIVLSSLIIMNTELFQALLVQWSKDIPSDTSTLIDNIVEKSSVLVVPINTMEVIHDIIARLECSLSQTVHFHIGVFGDLREDQEICSQTAGGVVGEDNVGVDKWEFSVGL